MLTIGLINNMTASAFYAVERRFIRVLGAAAQGIPIQLHYYATQHTPDDGLHRPLEALWDDALDGLLVTGAEPSAASVAQEPVWPVLTRVAKWAADNTKSAIWSCLAGHIAARYLDDVERVCHADKIFGVYESLPHTQHSLLAGIDGGWFVPHSRWHNLPADRLVANGYTILCSSPDAGVDRCIKTVGRSLFVLLQTHPEYGTSTLLREYRRDIERYHTGLISRRPVIPSGYLDPADVAALEAWSVAPNAGAQNDVDTWIDQITVQNNWSTAAGRFFRNWLLLLDADAHLGTSVAPTNLEHVAAAAPAQ